VEQRVLGGLTVLRPGSIQLELERLGERREHDFSQVSARLAPGQDDSLEDGDARISQDQLGVHLPPSAHTMTIGARAERRIEGELSRLELRQGETADRAGEALGEHDGVPGRLTIISDYFHDPISDLQRGLDRVIEPGPVSRPHDESIHDDGDIVVLPPIE